MQLPLDPRTLRKYVNSDPESNSTSKDLALADYEWQALDQALASVENKFMPITADLIRDGLCLDLSALKAMTAEIQSVSPETVVNLTSLPLPVAWKDFPPYLPNGELNLQGARAASRKVQLETDALLCAKLRTAHGRIRLIGRAEAILSKTPIVPTCQSINELHSQLSLRHFYGPYSLYHNPQHDIVLDDDYMLGPKVTLRQRLCAMDCITSVQRFDVLPPDELLLVQKTADTLRILLGYYPTVIGWEDKLRVVSLLAPQIRQDSKGNCGIAHVAPAS